MLISDWSSDVCSSDLKRAARTDGMAQHRMPSRSGGQRHRGLFLELSHARRMLSRQATERSFRRSSGADSIPRRQGKLAKARLGSRSEEHTSGLQSLMRISYAVFCLKKKKKEQTFKT